jgi:flagellar biosynthesis/type III secretory pathway chaperone
MQLSTNSYEELITILEREFTLCSDLVILLQKEKDIIGGLNLEALDKHLAEKQLVAAKIDVCEEERDRILSGLGIKGRTLSEIASVANAPYHEKLLSIASKFRSIKNSIAELNTLNSLLIEKSLFYIRSSRNFLNTFGINPQSRISLEA